MEKDKTGGKESRAVEFQKLEETFNSTLEQLDRDDSLEKFRQEYEKLYRHFKASHAQEKILIQKVRELNQQILHNASEAQNAMALNEGGQSLTTELKRKLEKTVAMNDRLRKKDIKTREIIRELTMEKEKLSALLTEGATLSIDHQSKISDLTKINEDMSRRLTESKEDNERQLESIQQLQEQMEAKREKNRSLNEKIQSLNEELHEKHKSEKREQRRKERMERELKDIRGRLEEKIEAYAVVDEKHRKEEIRTKQLRIQLKESEGSVEVQKRENKKLTERLQSLTVEKDEQIQKNDSLRAETKRLEQEILVRDRDLNRSQEAMEKLKRFLANEKKKVGRLENARAEEKMERDMLQEQIAQLNKEIVAYKKDLEAKKTQIIELHRSNDMQQKHLRRSEAQTKEQAERVGISERANRRLKGEINTYEHDVQEREKTIVKLEKARERVGMEATENHNRYLAQVEATKMQERACKELQKQIVELQHKLKAQQQLYETVRLDRNLYSKNLVESQDEIAEMKRKFKIMNQQIEQLKEEILSKDRAIVKEHFDCQKLEKQREQLKNELGHEKQLKIKADATIDKQKAEVGKLTSIIGKLEEDAVQQRKEYDQVINERDILGTQLIRRNDEIALLYEKIKIQQSTLHKGEAQFNDRIQEIRLMKIEVQDQRRKLKIASDRAAQVPNLKRELYNTQRELLAERLKSKAMSDELVNPLNVHRWRQLEGSDPTTHEMIQKIGMLQKRLIAKTEEVVAKDVQIKELEERYREVEIQLGRAPGQEIAEKLSVCQASVKEKARQMKAMVSELNMYQAQANESKYEIERLLHELNSVKRKYYTMKKEVSGGGGRGGGGGGSRAAKEQRRRAQEAHEKYTGGGYHVK